MLNKKRYEFFTQPIIMQPPINLSGNLHHKGNANFYIFSFSSAHPSPRAERRMGSTQALNGHSTAPPPQQHSGGSGFASPRPQPAPTATVPHANGVHQTPSSAQPVSAPIPLAEQSPRQQAFVDELLQRGAKAVQVTYDRVAQNQKELTVSRGEFLEVVF
jgi:hypothetical protein